MPYQPVITPQSLSQMNQVPVDLTLQAQDAMNRGISADQAGLQDMYGAYAHQQNMRPLQEQQQDIANQQGLAQLPGMQAESDIKQRTNKQQGLLFDADTKSKLNDFALKATDDELKQVAQHGQQLMYSLNPKEREQGQQIMAATQHMFEKRQEHFMKQEEEHIKGHYSVDVANILANSRVQAAGLRTKVSPTEAEMVGKMGFEKAVNYWNFKAGEALQNGDQEGAQSYRAEAQKAYEGLLASRTAGAGAAGVNKPDIAALTNGAVPTVQPQPVPQFDGSKAKPAPTVVAAPPAAIDHLKSNPGLAAAFDAKYGEGSAAKVLGK